jgi:glutamyl-tRNA synthetase
LLNLFLSVPRIIGGEEYSIRIKIPDGKTSFNDRIYGSINVENKEIDDFIIARTDGTPVYNLVVAVDDNDMGITHIIRGEDHIANTSKQIIIYNALDLPIPEFAHLPMILGTDKKRLSKRHGATGVQEFKDKGYLPDALVNYLALLGWNPGTEQEIFSSNELINEFSIERVQKKSAVFDERKLQWISSQHIHHLSAKEILKNVRGFKSDWRIDSEEKYVIDVIELMKERVRTLNDMQTNTEYFFSDPSEYDEKAARKKWKEDSINILIVKYLSKLSDIDEWKIVSIENELRTLAEREGISPGKVIHPTRLAISGTSSGPSLFDMMELLGKETCIRRLKNALEKLPLK